MTETVSDPAAPALIEALRELKRSVAERLDATIASIGGSTENVISLSMPQANANFTAALSEECPASEHQTPVEPNAPRHDEQLPSLSLELRVASLEETISGLLESLSRLERLVQSHLPTVRRA